MELGRHGLGLLSAGADVCALSPNGDPLVLWSNYARTADALRVRRPQDGNKYLTFRDGVDRAAALLADVLSSPPPDIDSPGVSDLWRLLKTGREFRGLGTRGAHQLLRWLPMPIADFAREWFEDELLRAAIAGPGVSGTMLGPRSAGSTLVMLLRETHRRLSGQRRLQVRGGPGRLTQAMAAAATAAGAEIRTGARVDRIVVRDERVAGLVVAGREIATTTILSSVDPKTTFLELFDPVDLTPDFLSKMRNYRAQGTVAKINLALAALPPFRGVTDSSMLTGHIHIGPDLDYLERAFDHAKYGEVSTSPWLDLTVPSVLDAELAPSGGHVMSGVRTLRALLAARHRLAVDATDPSDTCAGNARTPRPWHGFHDRERPDHHARGATHRIRVFGRTHLPWRARSGSAVRHAATARRRPLRIADSRRIPLRSGNASRGIHERDQRASRGTACASIRACPLKARTIRAILTPDTTNIGS